MASCSYVLTFAQPLALRLDAQADELIADPNVTAVYVASPPGSHLELAMKVLAAGKPCYVEKPLARNATESRAIADAFAKANVPLFVAYYRPVCQLCHTPPAENLLEHTGAAAACCPLLLLTCALLMTSSYSKAGPTSVLEGQSAHRIRRARRREHCCLQESKQPPLQPRVELCEQRRSVETDSGTSRGRVDARCRVPRLGHSRIHAGRPA